MKDDFNLENTLGLLAKAFSGRGFSNSAIEKPLTDLISHIENPQALDAFRDTIDYAVEKGGPQASLYMLHSLIAKVSASTTDTARETQAWLTGKWDAALEEGLRTQTDSVLDYLRSAGSRMKADDPLAARILKGWNDGVDIEKPADDFALQMTFILSDDLKNAQFRNLMLTRLAGYKDTHPAFVMKQMREVFDRGYYSFYKEDTASARTLVTTIWELYEKNKANYKDEDATNLSWKIFVSGEGLDPATEKKAAQNYLSLVAKLPPDKAFDMYKGLIDRRSNPSTSAEREEAAYRILDLADTGKIVDDGFNREVRAAVSDSIFYPAMQNETRNAPLAAKASVTLMNIVRLELAKKDSSSSYGHYNSALTLYENLEAGDKRLPGFVALWKDALARNFKGSYNESFYSSHVGAMLDLATKKGDTKLAEYARTEWRDSIERMAKKKPFEAYRAVQQIVVNAEHYGAKSELLKEAIAVFPSLETRAGIVKLPDMMNLSDYKKMLQQKRAPKP